MSPRFVVPIGVLFISLSAIFIRLSTAPPLAIATYRMAFATLLLLPLLLRREATPPVPDTGREARDAASQTSTQSDGTFGTSNIRANHPAAPPRRTHLFVQLSGLGTRDLLLCLVSGVFLAFHFATWIASVGMTSIASSTVLVNLQPIFVLAASAAILGERSSKLSILFVAVTILGCAVLSFGDARLGTHRLAGDGLALLGAVFVSGYMVIGRIVRQRVSARGYTLVVYASATVALLGLDLITGTSLWPFSIVDWLLFAALAVFSTLLGHSLLNWSLKYLKATIIATSVLAEPVVATLLAIPIFGEIPSLFSVAGGAVAIAGLYLFVRSETA